MKGYEFVVFNKSQTLRILFASDGFADQESMLSLFSPAQASRVHNIMKAGGGVCPCADETRCAVIFTDSVDYVAFAVILDRPCDGTLPTSAADIDDAVIKRLVNVFQRATHIGIVYERFPSEALIEANMLLCEFIRTRVVESNRIAASYGFAVVNARRLVTRLISLIVFISYILDATDDICLEIADCGGIFSATVMFSRKYLEILAFVFQRVCGDENVVLRAYKDGFSAEVIAAVEDYSKVGLKADVD